MARMRMIALTGSRNGKLQLGTEHILDCSTVVRLKQIPQVRVDRHVGGSFTTENQNRSSWATISCQASRLVGLVRNAFAPSS